MCSAYRSDPPRRSRREQKLRACRARRGVGIRPSRARRARPLVSVAAAEHLETGVRKQASMAELVADRKLPAARRHLVRCSQTQELVPVAQ